MDASSGGITENEVIDRASAFMEASFEYVDEVALDESELQRYVLCLFAFGSVHAFVEPAKLSQPQVETAFQELMKRLFDWPEEMLAGVTEMMIEATADEETRELIETGAEAIAAFENGEEEAVESLAALLEECEDEGDLDEEGDDDFGNEDEEEEESP
jgi:hypothetical protein